MTDHGAQTGPEAVTSAIPEAEVARELNWLAAAYPAFRLSREVVGRHGTCWVAQRLDRMADHSDQPGRLGRSCGTGGNLGAPITVGRRPWAMAITG